MDDLGKQVDLDVATILSEQIKDPVLSIVRSWVQSGTKPDPKSPEIR